MLVFCALAIIKKLPKELEIYTALALFAESLCAFIAMCCFAAMVNDCYSDSKISKGKPFVMLVISWVFGMIGAGVLFVPFARSSEPSNGDEESPKTDTKGVSGEP